MKKDGIREKANVLYSDSLHTEKGLFWKATQWRRLHYTLGIPSCVASVLAGLSIIQNTLEWAAALTILAAILTALLTFLDPDSMYRRVHEMGVAYGTLRGQIERFKDIDLDGKFDEAAARAELENFAAVKAELQRRAPHTGGMAHYFARKSIARGEHRA